MERILVGALLALWLSATPGAELGPNTYGHALLRQAAKANPEALALALHATPPKTRDSVVVASTEPAQLGVKSDPRELAVLASGQTTAAVSKAGDRLEVLLPLHDVSNDPIGLLGVSFAYHTGTDRGALERNAERIRDQLHRRIAHAGNLLDPYPYDPEAPMGTLAQKLADEFLEKYPEILIFAIHATPPNSDYNIIAGSNIGRIGKKGDNDDLRCVFTGKPNLEVNATGKRFEVEMQLHDRAGKVIGAVSVVYPYKSGVDKAALHARGERLRAELEKKIPDSDSLFRAAS